MFSENPRQEYLRQCQNSLQHVREHNRKLGIMSLAIHEFDKLKGLLGMGTVREIHRRNINLIGEQAGEDVHIIPQSWRQFVLIVDGVENTDSLTAKAEAILSIHDQTRPLQNQTIDFRYDVGVALYPGHGETPEDLLKNAEYAQYLASSDPVNSYSLYDPDEAQQSRADVKLSSEVSRALIQNEFELFFQPVVSVESGQIYGAECLIRWNHPDRGRLPAARFIPMTEATGQILFIDQWVLNRAVSLASEWFHQLDREFHLHFNISAIQFHDREFINKVQTALDDHEVPPHLLTLELTETAVMKDTATAEEVLEDLKNLGISLAMDDFGTGQSTFEYLNRFPLDRLKIDRQFLQFNDGQPEHEQLAKIMFDTGHRLHKTLIVEGVETKSQLRYIKENHCELAQGFYFTRPIPRTEINDLLMEGKHYQT